MVEIAMILVEIIFILLLIIMLIILSFKIPITAIMGNSAKVKIKEKIPTVTIMQWWGFLYGYFAV